MNFNLDKVEELVQLRPKDKNTDDLINACKEIRRIKQENHRMRELINSSTTLLELYNRVNDTKIR